MADNLRSKDSAPAVEENILGVKATGDLDADKDHLGNVEGGLKAAISNPNTSAAAKRSAEAKLEALEASKEVPNPAPDATDPITGRS